MSTTSDKCKSCCPSNARKTVIKYTIANSPSVFLSIAAYLVFGSWLNYNRYGARGWDLLPHGDTIRDVPYIAKDFGRKIFQTVQGSGSRGGYAAV